MCISLLCRLKNPSDCQNCYLLNQTQKSVEQVFNKLANMLKRSVKSSDCVTDFSPPWWQVNKARRHQLLPLGLYKVWLSAGLWLYRGSEITSTHSHNLVLFWLVKLDNALCYHVASALCNSRQTHAYIQIWQNLYLLANDWTDGNAVIKMFVDATIHSSGKFRFWNMQRFAGAHALNTISIFYWLDRYLNIVSSTAFFLICTLSLI